jgi:O-antigen/teichoic acid export membrane protein
VAWLFIPVLSAATVFTALDSFLGSVYFMVKRTSMSLYTSLIGAVVNIALNIIMIPDWGLGLGAMGASIATFVSYFLVYVIRAATMGRFMKFQMYHGKLLFNTVIMGAIVSLMTFYGYSGEIWGLWVSIGVLVISIVLNGRDVLVPIKNYLRR